MTMLERVEIHKGCCGYPQVSSLHTYGLYDIHIQFEAKDKQVSACSTNVLFSPRLKATTTTLSAGSLAITV